MPSASWWSDVEIALERYARSERVAGDCNRFARNPRTQLRMGRTSRVRDSHSGGGGIRTHEGFARCRFSRSVKPATLCNHLQRSANTTGVSEGRGLPIVAPVVAQELGQEWGKMSLLDSRSGACSPSTSSRCRPARSQAISAAMDTPDDDLTDDHMRVLAWLVEHPTGLLVVAAQALNLAMPNREDLRSIEGDVRRPQPGDSRRCAAIEPGSCCSIA